MKITRPESQQKMPDDAKLVFKGKIFDVYQWEQKMFDGSFQTFEKIKRPDTAIVIPVTEDKKIIIIEQEQPGGKPFISFPGGRLEENENPVDGARRELEEETGYSSNDFTLLHSMHPFIKIDWVLYFIIAKNCKKIQEQHLDAGEKIKLRFINFEEMVELLIGGEMVDEPELTSMALRAKLFPKGMDTLRKIILQ